MSHVMTKVIVTIVTNGIPVKSLARLPGLMDDRAGRNHSTAL